MLRRFESGQKIVVKLVDAEGTLDLGEIPVDFNSIHVESIMNRIRKALLEEAIYLAEWC